VQYARFIETVLKQMGTLHHAHSRSDQFKRALLAVIFECAARRRDNRTSRKPVAPPGSGGTLSLENAEGRKGGRAEGRK
jgi:hypothetical protein